MLLLLFVSYLAHFSYFDGSCSHCGNTGLSQTQNRLHRKHRRNSKVLIHTFTMSSLSIIKTKCNELQTWKSYPEEATTARLFMPK